MALRRALYLLIVLGAVMCATVSARAVEAVNVRIDVPAIDMTDALERHKTEVDRVQVSTAPGADGIVRRIEVRAREAGNDWAVFALANNSDEQIDRLIVVPHYRMVGSGLMWPDLGMSRIVNVTPSSGDRARAAGKRDRRRLPHHARSRHGDRPIVAELRNDRLPQLYLWEPDAYKDKINSFTLYYGIVIGIAGLLALFLTILFVVKGSVMFPAAAALGWAVLVYIGVDFGFWGKVFDLSTARRADVARDRRSDPDRDLAGLPVRLSQSQPLARSLLRTSPSRWLLFLGALVGVALFDPAIAAGSRAHVAGRGRRVRARPDRLSVDLWLSTAPCC